MIKPTLFIASSKEGLKYARAVHSELDDDCFVTPWNSVFQPTIGTLEQLIIEIEKYDYALIIFTPDDIRESRGQKSIIPRDNLVAELGMFLGKIGRERTFYMIPKNPKITLPSDFLGITPLTYNQRQDNYQAAVIPACEQIRSIINNRGPRKRSNILKVIEEKEIIIIEPKSNDTLQPEIYGEISEHGGFNFKVSGIVRDLLPGEELWLLHQSKDKKNIWPQQSSNHIDEKSGIWSNTCYTHGWGPSQFNIMAVIAKDEALTTFKDYHEVGKLKNQWNP